MATIATEPTSASGGILSCRVNGSDVEIPLDESGLTLLDVLRDKLGITSPKNGCEPQAQCGCCTVLMDGKPVLSCALKAEKAEGKTITTLEGLDEEHRQQIAESFVRCGGVQCGFCIPGMAMRGVRLCGDGTEPSREEIANSLSRTCAAAPATRRSSTASNNTPSCGAARRCRNCRPRTKSGKVGTSLPRYTGHDAVLGDCKYIDDITVPGMLYGARRVHRSSAGDRAGNRRRRRRWRCPACIASSPPPTCRASATSA